MGIGFVILLHLIAIAILSAIIATIAGIITYFISRKDQRKKRIFLAIASPFLGLYVLYFSALFGSILISAYKDIDIGIGDAWNVPLSANCKIAFIDILDNGYIECNSRTIISNVSKLQQVQNDVYGETTNGEHFLYKITSNRLALFNKSYFEKVVLKNKSPLKSAFDFYYDRRNEVAGFSLIVVGIFSLIISVVVIFIFKKIVLKF